LDNRDIRRDLWFASNTRAAVDGALDNRPLIAEILRLRRAKAELLGYRDFADFVLDERMAHTGERAQQFLEDLYVKTLPFFQH
jgi:oligopeptidase A